MEHLMPKNFTCTEPINIPDYFSKFTHELNSLRDSFNVKANLEKVCSVEKLQHKGEIYQSVIKETLCKRVSLESSAPSSHLQIQRMKEKWENYKEPKQTLSSTSVTIDHDEDVQEVEDLIANQDVVLVVRLFRPFLKRNLSAEAKYTHEIAILAKQTLADLRDTFKCVHDFVVVKEMEYPEDVTISHVEEQYPSGLIFIENCLYNDMRHPNAKEYSTEIIQWANSHYITDFTTGIMENTKLEDLKIRIGYPYVYRHQGNCEHLIVFTQIRLLRPDETLNSSKYPYIMSYNQFQRKFCNMCNNALPQYAVTDCDRLLKPWSFLCKECLLIYNYRDGNKVGEFKLYPFLDINKVSLL